MRKSTRSAFTLVELIVVITILAVLGTIAFISLQGYSADARNTKRTSDVNNIQSAISIKTAEGGGIMAFTTNVAAKRLADSTAQLAGADATSTNYDAGNPNYTALGVKADEFKDPNGQDYSIATTTTAGGRLEIAASIEIDGAKEALVKGTYSSRASADVTPKAVSGKVITLDPSDTNTFRTGDTVEVTGGTLGATAVIKKVARDWVTLTFSADATGATALKLATAEVAGLIMSRDGSNEVVVSGSGDTLPY